VPFTVPVFNILCDVWNAGKTPAADAPDTENVPCQFYVNSRGTFDVQPCEIEVYTPPLWVRLPIDQIGVWEAGQIFEVASESGRYYRARFKERMHYGFSNQYLIVVVVQCNAAGEPLIRDIENAVPCPATPTEDGEGSFSVPVAIEASGSASQGGLGQQASGQWFPDAFITCIGNATQV